MDKLWKALQKMSPTEQEMFLLLFTQLERDYTKVPHVLPLKGKKGWFRVRVGKYRVIFTVMKGMVEIQRLTKRNEGTYRGL